VACKAENNVSLGRFRAVIQEETVGTFPNTRKGFLPLMCNHCEGNDEDGVPPCVEACPEYPGKRLKYKTADGKTIRYRGGATYKRPDGLVLIDKELCADKCDMCVHRLDNGLEPSCVNTCQGRARIFGDLNDPDSEVSRLVKEHNLAKDDNVLLPEEGTRPHVFYIDPDNMLKTLYTKRKEKKLDHFVDQVV
jgi:tetrathionate reductase subunit B